MLLDINSQNKKDILKLLRSTKREGIDKLIKFLQKSDYFIAPCSVKYHLNTEGGLAQHSLNVYYTFKKLVKTFIEDLEEKGINIPFDTIIICSLLHDICKTNYYKKTFLQSIPLGKQNDNVISYQKYDYDDSLPLGHGEKSVIMLQKFIDLTEQEIMIIRWHMSGFDLSQYSKNSYYDATKKYPEIILFHSADYITTSIMEE